MIRPAQESELDYVYTTWSHAVLSRRRINSMRVKHLVAQINDALERATTLVDVRPGKRPEGDVVGWLSYTPLVTTGVVHWVYTRKAHRRTGIARGLLAHARIDPHALIPYTSDSSAAAEMGVTLGLRTQHVPMKDVIV